jgi:hypothetical protein
LLKTLFQRYQAADVIQWFARHSVSLKTEDDGRMFPETDSSQTIIDCFLRVAHKAGVVIETQTEVIRVEKEEDCFNVLTREGKKFKARKLLVCMGGHPQPGAYQWLADLGHRIIKPIPSLFTFNDPAGTYKHLMGVSVPTASVKIAGTNFSFSGPVLITHWGLSGPAIIRLSAWAAEWLAANNYTFTALVNWPGITKTEERVREELLAMKGNRPNLKVVNQALYGLPVRLWQALCTEAEIDADKTWSETSHKQLNRLLEKLIRCPFSIRGKTTFKEEFVTCGGVDLTMVNPQRMESTVVKNLFFAGEVLNLDGETGGFNFQCAWTTAWVAAQAIAEAEK